MKKLIILIALNSLLFGVGEAGAESGDLNLDGADNVQDVVILVNNILNP